MQRERISCVVLVIFLIFVLFIAGCDNLAGLNKVRKIEIGKAAPDFSLQDAAGNTWKLSDLRGKVVFINFWATWCKPLLAIVFNDDQQMAESFARERGATFPILANPAPELTEAYMITGVPETFVIDAKGILQHKYIGPYDWDAPEMKEMVQKFVNGAK